MSERENGIGLGDNPLKLNLVLEEISLNLANLSPICAAVDVLLALEAAPSLRRSVKWKNEPPQEPHWQYFLEAKSYFFTLTKIKKQAENGEITEPYNDSDIADEEESRPSLLGKLHAYEDVLVVLDKLLSADKFRSAN